MELTVKPVDPDQCPGSGTEFDPELANGAKQYYSPWATCSDCGKRVGLTARGSHKLRKHRK